MFDKYDLDKIKAAAKAVKNRYEKQLDRVKASKKSTEQIEKAVAGAIENLGENARSFVIYGEPQSGKTEMMICLTAKLLDDGHQLIIHLLNDSVDLLDQNLNRFKASGLTPSAKNFTEILDPAIKLSGQQHVVFCKKNGNDLRKLIEKIGKTKKLVIVDDEADYASPNSKINLGIKTPINDLITQILGSTGIYIGVTATPARLDLNNTFDNQSERWVDFPAHKNYTGQDVFFPLVGTVKYRRVLLSDSGSDPKHARDAFFRYLVTVAHLNLNVHAGTQRNYSFLVHTSGKKIDHKSDWGTIQAALNELQAPEQAGFAKYTEQLWDTAKSLYPAAEASAIVEFIVQNIAQSSIVVLNSERDWKENSAAATNPTSLFTIIIGGNIVSRGVTLENLVSMFFTRDVKHKIQQDTYIQRARMFGSRGGYLEHFELTIPEHLYRDWHRCFVFHRLSLSAIREKHGQPVWLGDHRIAAVSSPSVDRSTVDLNRGEMAFPLFDFQQAKHDAIQQSSDSNKTKLKKLGGLLGEKALPVFLLKYIESAIGTVDNMLAIHSCSDVSGYTADHGTNPENITRKKGFFGNTQKDAGNSDEARHHLKVFFNKKTQKARLIYKFEGSISFMKNAK